ncbi:histidine phosphatase family protein [Marinomonas mediterranea]|uniref:histidine phosphatase family protein n=1 Tax=Marinomonas mediterranea TaxID=119864 RepID=UPI00234A3EB3|nr:histidine phosphatase family protein [Marinomonas mediterranea]WCN08932.1 histidine phosphatase family protein [Marinomonas mediterranea]WCN12963.1 histidine phosphatase family protein [Marinomonas mediterranea]
MHLIRKSFVFARHAESEMNAIGKIGGSTDSNLSDVGRQQAKDASSLLDRPWSQVCTSTLKRTIQTAELAAPGQSLKHFSELCERDWGVLEQTPIPDSLDYFQTPSQGETWDDFYERVIKGINLIISDYNCPLIIAHSGVYRAINHCLYGSPQGLRIGNISPILIAPILGTQEWDVSPLEGHEL